MLNFLRVEKCHSVERRAISVSKSTSCSGAKMIALVVSKDDDFIHASKAALSFGSCEACVSKSTASAQRVLSKYPNLWDVIIFDDVPAGKNSKFSVFFESVEQSCRAKIFARVYDESALANIQIFGSDRVIEFSKPNSVFDLFSAYDKVLARARQ